MKHRTRGTQMVEGHQETGRTRSSISTHTGIPDPSATSPDGRMTGKGFPLGCRSQGLTSGCPLGRALRSTPGIAPSPAEGGIAPSPAEGGTAGAPVSPPPGTGAEIPIAHPLATPLRCRNHQGQPPTEESHKQEAQGGPKAGPTLSRRTTASTTRGKKPPPFKETGVKEGRHRAGGREDSSTWEESSEGDRTGRGEDAHANEETTRGDEAEGVDGERDTIAPTAPGSTCSSAGDARATPTAPSKVTTEDTGCTSTTTERRRSEAGALGPQSTPVGQTDQARMERQPEPPQEPHQVPAERGYAGESPFTQKRGKSSSRKTEGASARRASQPAATVALSTTPDTCACLTLIEGPHRKPTKRNPRWYQVREPHDECACTQPDPLQAARTQNVEPVLHHHTKPRKH
ncbi:treacle protein-like [Procambarus clarkii]|uniref:treacle protein-like n=1 Tax=Procambarus clarkii TaxID=6728 RepID=UPI003742378F